MRIAQRNGAGATICGWDELMWWRDRIDGELVSLRLLLRMMTMKMRE